MIHLTVGPNHQEDNEKFGVLLREFREAVHYSRADVSRRVDISSEYVRLFENGKRVPALGIIRKMLLQYEVPYSNVDEREIIIDNRIVVNSTSRILNAHVTKSQLEKQTRNETLGQVMTLLTQADDDVVKSVLILLKTDVFE